MRKKPVSHSNAPVHRIMKFIREERVRQGLTQEELSYTAGTSKSTLGRFECGINLLSSPHTIDRMLQALGCRLQIVREKKKGDK